VTNCALVIAQFMVVWSGLRSLQMCSKKKDWQKQGPLFQVTWIWRLQVYQVTQFQKVLHLQMLRVNSLRFSVQILCDHLHSPTPTQHFYLIVAFFCRTMLWFWGLSRFEVTKFSDSQKSAKILWQTTNDWIGGKSETLAEHLVGFPHSNLKLFCGNWKIRGKPEISTVLINGMPEA